MNDAQLTLMAAAFGVLLVFAIASLLVVRWQWRVMSTQVELVRSEIELTRGALSATQKAAEAALLGAKTVEQALQFSQAAALHVEAVHLLPDGMLNRNTVVSIVLANAGQTRAIDCEQDFMVGHPNRQGSERAKEPMPSVVGPGRRVDVRFGPLREFINDDALKHVLSGGMPLHFWGDISYKDVFGAGHRIRCGGTYSHESNEFLVEQNEVTGSDVVGSA
jgi:hypothetical protein